MLKDCIKECQGDDHKNIGLGMLDFPVLAMLLAFKKRPDQPVFEKAFLPVWLVVQGWGTDIEGERERERNKKKGSREKERERREKEKLKKEEEKEKADKKK